MIPFLILHAFSRASLNTSTRKNEMAGLPMVRVVAHALLLVRHCACVEFPGRGNASCDGAPLRVTSLALAGRHLEL